MEPKGRNPSAQNPATARTIDLGGAQKRLCRMLLSIRRGNIAVQYQPGGKPHLRVLSQSKSDRDAQTNVPYSMSVPHQVSHRAIGLTLALLLMGGHLLAQTPAGSSMPAMAPTQRTPANLIAPIAAVPSTATRPGERPHPAHVACANGQLEVRAENSSLNGILRAIARCNGMRISGGVAEQRVFGNYGPAAPATVLATLIDGTGSNMVLRETAADQPSELILTPRTEGVTPPSPASYAEAEEADDANDPSSQPAPATAVQATQPAPMQAAPSAGRLNRNQTPVLPPLTGSPVTNPPALPQPINNVNGSPANRSYTAGSFPTTNSVPLDSVATPSTTPATSGIVDSPNPPPAGSDTAAALSGAPAGTPGTTNINPGPTSATSTPGASNTTIPAPPTQQATPSQLPADLTPEQIFQQLQERQRRQQQQQQEQNNPPQ